jgi:hypothetical protein
MGEWILHDISAKIIYALLIVIGGVLFVIKRVLVAAIEKRRHFRTIQRIKERPRYAEHVANNLDTPYSKKHPFHHFDSLKQYIGQRTSLNGYNIEYTVEVSRQEFLVFTSIAYVDFDVGLIGKNTNVNKRSYIIFLLKYIPEEATLMVQSDTYTTPTEKFQREGFVNSVFKGM